MTSAANSLFSPTNSVSSAGSVESNASQGSSIDINIIGSDGPPTARRVRSPIEGILANTQMAVRLFFGRDGCKTCHAEVLRRVVRESGEVDVTLLANSAREFRWLSPQLEEIRKEKEETLAKWDSRRNEWFAANDAAVASEIECQERMRGIRFNPPLPDNPVERRIKEIDRLVANGLRELRNEVVQLELKENGLQTAELYFHTEQDRLVDVCVDHLMSQNIRPTLNQIHEAIHDLSPCNQH
ncbi:MAG TPA: hypothetical protein VLE89_04555 [Chlamydiales bacterium]|nr:hypothetical protein [Chlamydiales bacterium]